MLNPSPRSAFGVTEMLHPLLSAAAVGEFSGVKEKKRNGFSCFNFPALTNFYGSLALVRRKADGKCSCRILIIAVSGGRGTLSGHMRFLGWEICLKNIFMSFWGWKRGVTTWYFLCLFVFKTWGISRC